MLGGSSDLDLPHCSNYSAVLAATFPSHEIPSHTTFHFHDVSLPQPLCCMFTKDMQHTPAWSSHVHDKVHVLELMSRAGKSHHRAQNNCKEVANRGFDYRQIAKSLIGKAQDLTPEAGPTAKVPLEASAA